MKKIPLTKGYFAIVDDEDYPNIVKFKWCFHAQGYACRVEKKKMILMHRFIMRVECGKIIDHKDRNKLNNTRKNLRIVSYSQNNANSKTQSNNTSGYRGVAWDKQTHNWKAICRGKNLGRFSNIKKAALAYNKEAIKQWGEFAQTNRIS